MKSLYSHIHLYSALKLLTPVDRFGIVAAMSQNRVIGVQCKLPWNLPGDRKAFKALTENKILIVGRRTFEEQPNQCHISHAAKCIVVSKSIPDDFGFGERIKVARSFPEALHVAREVIDNLDLDNNPEEIYCWVAGGEKIYHEALLHPSAHCLYLTLVDFEADTISNDGDDHRVIARFPAKYRWDNKYEQESKEERPGYTQYVYRRLRGK
jgi:dihydrofolate reductase